MCNNNVLRAAKLLELAVDQPHGQPNVAIGVGGTMPTLDPQAVVTPEEQARGLDLLVLEAALSGGAAAG
jgi:hypothetical protein